MEERQRLVPNWDKRKDEFDSMGLSEQLLCGVYGFGFTRPSEVEAMGIYAIVEGRDTMMYSPSGTGKDSACAIGMLARVDVSERSTQALVLAPSREMAFAVHAKIGSIGQKIEGLKVALAVGGTMIKEAQQTVAERPHVVVATPGRCLDLIKSGCLVCDRLKIVCVEELADMAGMFEAAEECFSCIMGVNNGCQIVAASPVVDKNVYQFVQAHMRDSAIIEVIPMLLTLEGIRQFFVNCDQEQFRADTLVDICQACRTPQTIVWADADAEVEDLARRLEEVGVHAMTDCRRMAQEQRSRNEFEFVLRHIQVLIVGGLISSARLERANAALVINYRLPETADDYLRRVGRSGCYGRKGIAISLVTSDDVARIDELTRAFQTRIEELPDNVADFFPT